MPTTKKTSKVTKKTSATKSVAAKATKKAAPKKGSKKGSKKAAPKKSSKKGSKKAAPKKGSKKAAPKKSSKKGSKKASKKNLRSFKVMLPGTADYSGRFTGLTPYQAANKALSKYFRENNTVKSKISFTIKESTRSSKRGEYTYTGKRLKLDVPIQYEIGEGKIITKKYKNKLTKVKKGSKVTV
jgi:hypothetical protein